MYIKRIIETEIKKYLSKGKVLLVYGPRQSGKTTMVRKIAGDLKIDFSYLNCDELSVRTKLQTAGNSWELKQIIGNRKLVIIDEAQRIKDIGIKLKLLVDNFPNQQILATGSSSFDLSNEINEPLTGRHFDFPLYPFHLNEIRGEKNAIELAGDIESNILIYGLYPAVYLAPDRELKRKELKVILGDYLFKDVLKFFNLKNSVRIQNLVQALALQIGSEVSFNELGRLLEMDKSTVESYVNILEQCFIIFRLNPFSNNKRQELNRMRKIYFYDLGIRNALTDNLNPLNQRDDIGKLWENFVISERIKAIRSRDEDVRTYFWRTYDGAEIDLVEEEGGKLSAFEIRWQKPKKNPPKAWRVNYPQASWTSVTKDNYFVRTASDG